MSLVLSIATITTGHQFDRMTTLYKIQRGLVETDTGDIASPNAQQRSTTALPTSCRAVTVYKNSFFPRTTRKWNLLQTNLTDAATLEEFRVGLGTVLLIIMKRLDPLRAKKTFIRKKLGHTTLSAIKASSVTL